MDTPISPTDGTGPIEIGLDISAPGHSEPFCIERSDSQTDFLKYILDLISWILIFYICYLIFPVFFILPFYYTSLSLLLICYFFPVDQSDSMNITTPISITDQSESIENVTDTSSDQSEYYGNIDIDIPPTEKSVPVQTREVSLVQTQLNVSATLQSDFVNAGRPVSSTKPI